MEALERTHEPDLMILDIMMPKMDSIRRLMADTSLLFIPVLLVTAKADGKDMIAGLEGGDDDYLTNPVDHAALSARVRSMLWIKARRDTVQAQSGWRNKRRRSPCGIKPSRSESLTAQLGEIERISRLKQFLAPQITETVISSGGETILDIHQSDIVVLFCDMRGFNGFSEMAAPEV